MLLREPLLVTFVKLVDRIPTDEGEKARRRGRPKVYEDRLMVKALVIMIIRHLYSAYSLLAFLEQDTELTQQLRALLTTSDGCFATRRTWERRLAALPTSLPGLIGSLGRYLVACLQPWREHGRAVAADSTPLHAKGGVWHKRDREARRMPHSSIDTEADWSKSGYHGWWYGWKLHLAAAVYSVWIPLAAELTCANTYDGDIAPLLLGDSHYRDATLQAACETRDCILVTPHSGRYPHADPGVEVRRIFHKLRSKTIEPFNSLFKRVFEWGGQVPVKGLGRTQLVVLGAVFLYQLVLLYQFDHGLPRGKCIKPLPRAA